MYLGTVLTGLLIDRRRHLLLCPQSVAASLLWCLQTRFFFVLEDDGASYLALWLGFAIKMSWLAPAEDKYPKLQQDSM